MSRADQAVRTPNAATAAPLTAVSHPGLIGTKQETISVQAYQVYSSREQALNTS